MESSESVIENKCDDDDNKLDVTCETDEAPLMVAMQPEVDVSAVEVEIVTQSAGESDQNASVERNDENVNYDGTVNVKEEKISSLYSETIFTSPSSDYNYSAAHDESSMTQHRTSERRKVKPRSRLSPTLVNNKSQERSPKIRILKRPRKDSTTETESDEDGSDTEIIYDRYGKPVAKKKPPKKREFSYRLQWKNKDMLEAMKFVLEKKTTIRGAAKKFGVPYSTLKDRIHGRVQHGTRPGVKTALSPEEEEDLVRYVKDMDGAGFSMRCIDVRVRAGEIINLNHGINSPYTECAPGHNWLSGFLKRHEAFQGMEFKKSVARTSIPSIQKQRGMCKRFFEMVDRVYRKYRLTTRPDRVYAVAELSISSVLDANLLMAGSADGTILPPFVIFPGQRIKLTAARQVYPEAFFTSSGDGRCTDVILLWWFRDHFIKQLPMHVQRPVILLVDRPVNEITFQLMQLAREEKVHIISIPVGITHLLNPVDDVIGRTVENQVTRRARKWEEENPGVSFTQKVLATILHKVWRKGDRQRDIINKYAENGIFPLNPNIMTLARITVATQQMKAEPSPPAGYGKADPNLFSGLNLLSALSSHEYASLDSSEQTGNYENHTVTSHARSRNLTQDERVVVQVNHRLALGRPADELQPQHPNDESAESEQDEDLSKHDDVEANGGEDQELDELLEDERQPKLMVSMLPSTPEQDTSHNDENAEDADVTDAEPSEKPCLQKELVAARDNRAQIDAAIESIGGVLADDNCTVEITQVTEQEVIEEIVEDVYEEGVEESGMEVLESDQVVYNGHSVPVIDAESGEMHYLTEGIDTQPIEFLDSGIMHVEGKVQYVTLDGQIMDGQLVDGQLIEGQPVEEVGSTSQANLYESEVQYVDTLQSDIQESVPLEEGQYTENIQYITDTTEGHLAASENLTYTELEEGQILTPVDSGDYLHVNNWVSADTYTTVESDISNTTTTSSVAAASGADCVATTSQYQETFSPFYQVDENEQCQEGDVKADTTAGRVSTHGISQQTLSNVMSQLSEAGHFPVGKVSIRQHHPGVAVGQTVQPKQIRIVRKQLSPQKAPANNVSIPSWTIPSTYTQTIGGPSKCRTSHDTGAIIKSTSQSNNNSSSVNAEIPVENPVKPATPNKPSKQRVIRIVQPKGRKLTAAQLQQIAAQVLPAGATGRIVVQESKE